MLHEDKESFAQAMNAMAAAFDKEIDEATLEAYWMALEDMPIGAIESAVRDAMRKLEYFPRPAHLRRSGPNLDPEARAILAWQAAVSAVGRHGAYTSVEFDDPLTNAAIRNLGGWNWFCSQPEKDFHVWVRRGFEKIYVALASSGVVGDGAGYLPGIHERANLGEAPEITRISTGLPELKVKQLGDGNAASHTHYIGQTSKPEEREENHSRQGADVYRLIKKSFGLEK